LLRKPFTEEVLIRKVREVLDGSGETKKTECAAGAESPVAAGPDAKLN
jgi:hypothetical protein